MRCSCQIAGRAGVPQRLVSFAIIAILAAGALLPVTGCGGGGSGVTTHDLAAPDPWEEGARGLGETYRGRVTAVGRWPQLTLPSPGELTIRCSPGLSPDHRLAVEEAAHDWEQATRGRVQFRLLADGEDSARADITVATANSLAPPGGGSAAGFSWMERDTGDAAPEGSILWARVLFVPAVSTTTGGGVRGVVRHELGHALGLGGHSPHSDDLMHESGTGAISRRDVRTLAALYRSSRG